MLGSDASPTGVNDPNILWILIALANGDVDVEDAAVAIGIPEGQVSDMLAMAAVRGKNALDFARLQTANRPPAISLARTEDVEAVYRAAQGFVPESVVQENVALKTAMRRIGKIVERGRVWTNN
jgi:hypothetical protein